MNFPFVFGLSPFSFIFSSIFPFSYYFPKWLADIFIFSIYVFPLYFPIYTPLLCIVFFLSKQCYWYFYSFLSRFHQKTYIKQFLKTSNVLQITKDKVSWLSYFIAAFIFEGHCAGFVKCIGTFQTIHFVFKCIDSFKQSVNNV